MTGKRFSNVAGFDDAPFDRDHRGPVQIVGTIYADLRFDGVLIGKVEKDGFNAATRIIEMIEKSNFQSHIRMIMLQGIALAGFNVVDVFDLHKHLGIPVLVVARRQPDMAAIHRALSGDSIPRGKAKWELIQRLGPMETAGKVLVQRVGLSMEQAMDTIDRFSVCGNIPEPLRTAHLIAGALSTGHSRGRS